MQANQGKDPRYQEKSPHSAAEQDQPAPERPVPAEERRREGSPENKPSQAEGERDGA
ncbi:MAG TPA: hypothetical protein VF746_12920 [Longimicrobium sp.]|jgi:hypothetical protein